LHAVQRHQQLSALASRVEVDRREGDTMVPAGEWAVVTSNGYVHCHPRRRGEPEEWTYVIAHCLLHLGLGHLAARHATRNRQAWNAACDHGVELFLDRLKIGRKPNEYALGLDHLPREEVAAYEQLLLRDGGDPGAVMLDLRFERSIPFRERIDWSAALAAGLRDAVDRALAKAAGRVETYDGWAHQDSAASAAHRWFIGSYPLLGSLAAAFRIVDDAATCRAMGIAVGAVDASERKIYINPVGLSEREIRFVMAHEILHVALRHQARCQGRHHYLWNVACDFAINLWLVEMGIGEMPSVGGLYDPALKGLSAETIYDRIARDLRMLRRTETFCGHGKGDMLGDPDWSRSPDGMALDDFYREALAQGLTYHESTQPGSLPAGLLEEIRAQIQPPIPWEVELSNWFDQFFAPIETRRSYHRPSRRQAATPDIPRPRAVPVQDALDGRTFGVVLDTSGSMDRVTLARGLGAIAAYAMSREVPAVRVVFCDAHAYDAGYMSADAIAGEVRVRGRGGTILQPGIDLLENAEDFPDDGPILVITDTGLFDRRLTVRHEHAYLVPQGQSLPFPAKGPVFHMPPSQGEGAW